MQPQVLVVIIFFVVVVIIAIIPILIRQKRIAAFKNYIKNHFPDISEKEQIFRAQRSVISITNDIALIINEAKKELIVLLIDNGGKEISHRVYPFKDLTSVKFSDRIISMGGYRN